MYWATSQKAGSPWNRVHRNASGIGDGRSEAFELFRAYEENYPLFWARIEYDPERLARIFEFFFAMHKLLASTPPTLMDHLHRRLRARYYGGPPPFPFGFEEVIAHFAQAQIEGLRALGAQQLLSPAFELFAAGALSSRQKQDCRYGGVVTLEAPAEPAEKHCPEPDGAAFFYWAEFAFLASYAGHDPDEWKETLPILIRAERIYIRCYGQPVNGRTHDGITFRTYRDSREYFVPMHPDDAKMISEPSHKRFDELEAEATRCSMAAFPGGIEP